MQTPTKQDNIKAVEAGCDKDRKNRFLMEEKVHILRLAAVILRHRITDSDDEFSIAFIAVSDAIDHYSEEKGDFWAFAAVVTRNRLYDYLRRQKRIGDRETSVSPEAFSGDAGEDDETDAAAITVAKISAKKDVDSDLKQEIAAIRDELNDYDITFRDLAEVSPKSEKTKRDCGLAVAAMFLPPPLVELLMRKKRLPLAEIEKRSGVKRKLLDRHRKHIVAATLVCAGDYPNLQEYFPYRQVFRP